MAITAVRLWPKSPEIMPDYGGLLEEIWQVTFDGSAGSVTIQAQTMRYVVAANCAGSSNNITSALATDTVIFTFTTGQTPVNGATAQAFIYGRE